jgi:hypothetical protein
MVVGFLLFALLLSQIALIYEKYQKNQRHNKYHNTPLFQAPQSRAPSLKKVPIIRRV